MAYSIDRAVLLAEQIERLRHLNAYQLAGQLANLDFWLDEAASALRTIDEYPARFRRLGGAQTAWVKAHGIKVSGYCGICQGGCELGPQTPGPPVRISSGRMAEARARVCRAVYQWLLRCHRCGLLDEPSLHRACDRVGVLVEHEDL